MRLSLNVKQGRLVPGAGPRDARVLYIAEAPGEVENRIGIPMVGRSGEKQAACWAKVGLDRKLIRVENVIQVRPPGNDLDGLPIRYLEKCRDEINHRIRELEPNVIATAGNFAFNCLRRFEIRKRRDKGRLRIVYPDKILSWRGSICSYRADDGRKIKLIPTLHPRALLSSPRWEGRWLADWKRIAEDSEFPQLRRLRCKHHIFPTIAELQRYHEKVARATRDRDSILAIDIETPGRVISCVGFALTPDESMTVGLLPYHWKDKQDLRTAWKIVRALCALPIAKSTHGGLFDAYYLAMDGRPPIWLRDWLWDTQAMHHCMDSSDEHSLAYCASLDLRVEFWKDEAKEADGEYKGKYKRDTEQLHTYNGKDCCYTRALTPIYIDRLIDMDLLEFYEDIYRAKFYPVLRMMLEGIPTDEKKRELAYEEQRLKQDIVRRELKGLAGEDLVAKKGLSPTRVIRYFYQTLGCKPPRAKRGRKGKLSADETNIRWLMLRNKKAVLGGQKVLDYRRHGMLLNSFSEARVDDDRRFRSTYKFLTRWGRFASTRNPKGGGGNAQAIDREIRGMFVPIPGHIMWNVDASQGESRIRDAMCYTVSGDPYMLKLATTSPLKMDQHREHAASILFIVEDREVDPSEVSEVQRQIGKRTNHAVGYGMRGAMMADQVLTESKGAMVLTPDECEEFIDALLEKLKAIPQWQEEIRYRVQHDRMLENAWGRRFLFTYDRLEDKTYRDAYSCLPQSNLVDLLNQQGLIPLDEWIQGDRMQTKILAQGHDSLLGCSPPDEIWDVVSFLAESLSQPVSYWGTKVAMPIGVEIGMSWGKSMLEWKELPEKKAFLQAVDRLLSC